MLEALQCLHHVIAESIAILRNESARLGKDSFNLCGHCRHRESIEGPLAQAREWRLHPPFKDVMLGPISVFDVVACHVLVEFIGVNSPSSLCPS